MKYKVEHLNQSRLGSLFGTTSHVVGKWLVEIGLRDEMTKRPTPEAHQGGYVVQVWSGGKYAWEWEPAKTVAALQKAGHQLVLELPPDIVEPPPLVGPFRLSETDKREILDADGSPAIRTTSSRNSVAVLKLLELAHTTGALRRLLEGTSTLPTGCS